MNFSWITELQDQITTEDKISMSFFPLGYTVSIVHPHLCVESLCNLFNCYLYTYGCHTRTHVCGYHTHTNTRTQSPHTRTCIHTYTHTHTCWHSGYTSSSTRSCSSWRLPGCRTGWIIRPGLDVMCCCHGNYTINVLL